MKARRTLGIRGRSDDNMIKVSVLYPAAAGSAFNMDYYLNRHIPMVREKLGTACKSAAVEQGLGGATPGSPPAFISAMGHLYFDSEESFQAAFGPHAGAIMGDIPNYTNVQPTIEVSEVKL
jgi:uncharacterized protein (TIGR02118 family)